MQKLVWAALGAVVVTQGAHALVPVIDEVRVNATHHDVTVFNSGTGGKESGANIQAEVLFDSPLILAPILSPRPHVMFSHNTAGETNFGGIGLSWTTPAVRRIYAGLDFGVVWHDGVVSLPPEPSDPTRIRLAEERVIFGSRDLFRTALSAGYRVHDNLDVALVFEHLSHGQVLGNGKNEGLDSFGVRIGWRPGF